MSRNPVFQHLKPISAKAFEVCRPSKPSSLLTMDCLNSFIRNVRTLQRVMNENGLERYDKTVSPWQVAEAIQVKKLCSRWPNGSVNYNKILFFEIRKF